MDPMAYRAMLGELEKIAAQLAAPVSSGAPTQQAGSSKAPTQQAVRGASGATPGRGAWHVDTPYTEHTSPLADPLSKFKAQEAVAASQALKKRLPSVSFSSTVRSAGVPPISTPHVGPASNVMKALGTLKH